MLVTARSAREYAAMLDLDPTQLRGRSVVDVAAGASSFTAVAAAAGARAVAVDPVYACSRDVLRRRAGADRVAGDSHVARHTDAYTWGPAGFRDPAAHAEERARSLARFLADHATAPAGRYVAAALPRLPFADDAFDLAVSTHLLFTHPDLGAGLHVAAVAELARVAREVRLYPLVTAAGAPSRHVAAVVDALGHLHVERRPVRWRLQPLATHALVLTRRRAADGDAPARGLPATGTATASRRAGGRGVHRPTTGPTATPDER